MKVIKFKDVIDVILYIYQIKIIQNVYYKHLLKNVLKFKNKH